MNIESNTPAVQPVQALPSGLRIHMVDGDRMEPLLRGSRDYVFMAPVDAYCGEGIYLLADGAASQLYRVSSSLDRTRRVILSGENRHYEDHVISIEQFNDNVLGIVVADIRVRDERFLRGRA